MFTWKRCGYWENKIPISVREHIQRGKRKTHVGDAEDVYLPENGCFIEAVRKWLEEKEAGIKKQTYMRYQQCIDTHIIPYFGDVKCSAITQNTIDDFLKQKRLSGRLDGKGGLSQSTIRGMCIVLQSILLFAYQKKMGIPEMIQIKKPRVEK